MSEAPFPPQQTMGDGVSLKKILAYAASAVVAISVLTVSVFLFMGWRFVKGQEAELFDDAKARALVAEVRADLDAVRADPFFQEVVKAEALSDPASNAGGRLNRMLSWNIPEESDGNPPAAGGLELPDDLADRLDDWGDSWADHAGDLDPSTLDFAWMGELRAFRYWTLDFDSPLGDALERNPDLDPLQFPSPDYRALTAWVKLRLLSALTAEDPQRALDEVRHLAFLCLTTSNLVTEMVGIRYLTLLGEAEAKLDRSWLDLALVEKARRVFWGEQAYLDFTVPDDLFREVFPDNALHPGACAAMDERLPFAAFARETLEPFYEDAFERFDARLATLRKGCRPTPSARHYDKRVVPLVLSGNLFDAVSPAPSEEPHSTAFGEAGRWENVKKVRFARHALGLILSNLGKTNGLEPYGGDEEN